MRERLEVKCRAYEAMKREYDACGTSPKCGFCRPALNKAFKRGSAVMREEQEAVQRAFVSAARELEANVRKNSEGK